MNRTIMRYIGLAVVSVLGSCGFFPEEDEIHAATLPEPPRATRIITYPVVRKDIYEQIDGNARTTSLRETELYFTGSGRIKLINVKLEQTVRKGEVLAKLEIDHLEYQLAVARLDREIARTNLERLTITGSPPIDRKIQRLVVAKHDLTVSYLDKQVAASTITAPHDGIVEKIQAKPTDLVKEYEAIIKISDPSELELQMSVSQSDFYNIQTQMEALVEVKTGSWVPVEIVQTTHRDPRLDTSIRREEFIVHLGMPEIDTGIAANTLLSARIIVFRRENTLVIPSAGLREFGGRKYVRVLDGETRREIDVKTGLQTAIKVEILEGLQEGDLVIGK